MARVVSAPQGELAGKLGGVVYARNKSGPIARAYTKPSGGNTIKRIQARQAFGSVTTLFRQLTSTQKTEWQQWADNYFVPKMGVNTGQFSGYNAFIALRGLIQQAYLQTRTFTVANTGTDITADITLDVFTPMPETPLAQSFSGAVEDDSGIAQVLSIDSATVNTDGSFDINLKVGDGTGHDLSNNVDPDGSNIGIVLYMSNGNPSPNMGFGNEFAHTLGYLAPWSADAPSSDLLAVETLEYSVSSSLDTGRSKRWPLLNEYVLVTAFAINKYGQMSRIGATEVQMT